MADYIERVLTPPLGLISEFLEQFMPVWQLFPLKQWSGLVGSDSWDKAKRRRLSETVAILFSRGIATVHRYQIAMCLNQFK
jgi:hypothetical protein